MHVVTRTDRESILSLDANGINRMIKSKTGTTGKHFVVDINKTLPIVDISKSSRSSIVLFGNKVTIGWSIHRSVSKSLKYKGAWRSKTLKDSGSIVFKDSDYDNSPVKSLAAIQLFMAQAIEDRLVTAKPFCYDNTNVYSKCKDYYQVVITQVHKDGLQNELVREYFGKDYDAALARAIQIKDSNCSIVSAKLREHAHMLLHAYGSLPDFDVNKHVDNKVIN